MDVESRTKLAATSHLSATVVPWSAKAMSESVRRPVSGGRSVEHTFDGPNVRQIHVSERLKRNSNSLPVPDPAVSCSELGNT